MMGLPPDIYNMLIRLDALVLSMPEDYSVIPKGKRCSCYRHFAKFKVTYGRHLGKTENPHILNVAFLCELCLLDYERTFKNGNVPYKVEENREVVQFT